MIFLLEAEDSLLATQHTPLPARQIKKIYICENNDVVLVHVKSLGHTLLDLYLEQFGGIFPGNLEHLCRIPPRQQCSNEDFTGFF